MAEKTTMRSGLERASGLSDDMIESVEAGRRAPVEAVRKFVNAIEEATAQRTDPSRRKNIIDAALNLADELSAAQVELIHSVASDAREALSKLHDEM